MVNTFLRKAITTVVMELLGIERNQTTQAFEVLTDDVENFKEAFRTLELNNSKFKATTVEVLDVYNSRLQKQGTDILKLREQVLALSVPAAVVDSLLAQINGLRKMLEIQLSVIERYAPDSEMRSLQLVLGGVERKYGIEPAPRAAPEPSAIVPSVEVPPAPVAEVGVAQAAAAMKAVIQEADWNGV